MRNYEMDFTNGSLWKKIWIFSVPLMFSNVLQVIFNMADVAVVGKFAGPIALGAVGSTSILITLFIGILLGMANGVNALTALYIGAKDEKSIRETVHTAVILCFSVGALIMLLGIMFSKGILGSMNTKDELIHEAALYLRIYLLGMPAMALYNFGNAVLSAAGDTKRPLYYLLFAGIINVVLNLFFVITCKLGVVGVALASIIAQYVSALLVLRALFKGSEAYQLQLKYLKLTPSKVKGILHIGIPSAMQYTIFAIANLFVQTGVNSFDHVIVEGNSAAANADPLVYDMMAAFYTACTSFMAQNLGAKQKKRALKSYFICLLYSFVMGLVLGIAIYVFRYEFLGMFTNDAVVVEAGVNRLAIMALSYSISAFMDCSIAASRGLGKTIVPTIIVIIGSCVFRVIWVYTIFAHFRTIEALYLVYPISWIITATAEGIYFIWAYKKGDLKY